MFIFETKFLVFLLFYAKLMLRGKKMRKIRVLAIAPYEALKTQILALAEGFNEIEITPFVGDLEEGLEIAEANFHGNFDIVLSRGATAELLRAKLSIPVVGIDISIYDILFALRLSDADTDETAIVSFADLRDNVRTLSTLTEYRLDCFIIPEAKDARSVLIECKRKGYKTVLCDMIADRIAKELGLNSFLITSGESSIINAFKEILRLAKAMDDLRSENALLRTLFLSQIGKTVVLDDEKRLFLSSVEEIDSSVLEMLRAEVRDEGESKVVRIRNGIIYSIRIKNIEMGGRIYHAFFYTERKNALQPERSGIEFLSPSEVEQRYYSSLFFMADTLKMIREQIAKSVRIPCPVLIYGESGTGKQSMAHAIYLMSKLKSNPFIQIDCSMVNDKSWDFLMNSTNSPLSSLDQTIYFSNLGKLGKNRIMPLITALKDIGDEGRIKIIFSSATTTLGETERTFLDTLGAVSIKTLELRNQRSNISILLKRLLSSLNATIPHSMLGVQDDALEMLMNYPWPNNFTQFERLVKELIIITKGPLADKESVKAVLDKEEHTVFLTSGRENDFPLSLNKSLKEIEKEIARKVLEEEGGNQSATAKRLDISRTTLWRMLSG